MKGRSAISFIATLLLALGIGAVSAGSDVRNGARRVAPMTVENTEPLGGLVVVDPVIVDSQVRRGRNAASGAPQRRTGRPLQGIPLTRIDRFEFRIDRVPEDLPALRAKIEIESRGGSRFTFQADFRDPAVGKRIRIPAEQIVTRKLEGPFRALLQVTGPDGTTLFQGTYGFGYPRYHSVQRLVRIHDGAPIRDDFESAELDEDLWRIRLQDPEHARIEQRDGRLWIHAEGGIRYNGLASRRSMDIRDVEVVCMAGVNSGRPLEHPALVHLCGGGKLSPDNWFELELKDGGENRARIGVRIAAPPRYVPEEWGSLDILDPSGEGFLLKIISDPAAQLIRGLVFTDGLWRQVGDALEVPARSSTLEIKTAGFGTDLTTSTVWFDDCRLYPRAKTHFVTIKLERPGGGLPGGPGVRQYLQVLFDHRNREFSGDQVLLKLYTADGRTLVDEANPGSHLDYAMLTLRDTPWDTYPVEALLRIFLGDEQIGPDLRIERAGVEGLYPDDVYLMTFE